VRLNSPCRHALERSPASSSGRKRAPQGNHGTLQDQRKHRVHPPTRRTCSILCFTPPWNGVERRPRLRSCYRLGKRRTAARSRASVGIPKELLRSVAPMDKSISGWWVATRSAPARSQISREKPGIQELSLPNCAERFVRVPCRSNGKAATPHPIVYNAALPRVIAVLNVTEKSERPQVTEGDLKDAEHRGPITPQRRSKTSSSSRTSRTPARNRVHAGGEIVEARSSERATTSKRRGGILEAASHVNVHMLGPRTPRCCGLASP